MNVQVAIALLELAMKYGVPAVQEVLKTWGKSEITMDDVVALKSRIKEPEEYD